MLREQALLFNRLQLGCDVLLSLFAYFLTYFLLGDSAHLPLDDYIKVVLAVVVIWPVLLYRYGLYASIRRIDYFEILWRLINCHVMGGVVLAAAVFVLEREMFSRRFLLTFLAISLGLYIAQRFSVLAILRYYRRKGFNTRNLLIVGNGDKARKFIELVEDERGWGLRILGFVHVMPDPAPETILGYPVLGTIDQLLSICKEQPVVDEVVFCLPKPKDLVLDIEHHLVDLEQLGITVRMILADYEVYSSRRELALYRNQLPILTYYSKAFDPLQLFLKRALDVCGALVGLILLALMFPVIATVIKISSPGPIFFGQKRVGENGRIFKCWKFRSMYVDAEERKRELLANNEMKGAIFKISNDPRIFPFGHFLRKTSLDEFPQFWNVLRGEMSLVGTRPPTPDEVSQYEDWHRRRISIKPGITGLWQVSGRNQISDFDEIVRLDLRYIDQWNIGLDLLILCKTLKVVFFREGSC